MQRGAASGIIFCFPVSAREEVNITSESTGHPDFVRPTGLWFIDSFSLYSEHFTALISGIHLRSEFSDASD